MGRTSWEGWQAEIRTPRTSDPERAPAESPYEILAGASEPQRGRARGHWGKASNFPLATLPSLFDPLRRPNLAGKMETDKWKMTNDQ